MRKPPPERIYRVEMYDLREGSTYLNSTKQFLNRPKWWPGPGEKTYEKSKAVYREGRISWDE